MPLTSAQPNLLLPRVENWIRNQGNKLTCPVCGNPADQWESANLFEIQFQHPMGVHPHGRFIVLTCTCGYSAFIRAAAMKL